VAPLDRLAHWCLPLLRPGGRLLAMKGARAADEVDAYQDAVRQLGGTDVGVIHCGTPPLDHPVTVVQVRRGSQSRPGGARDSRPSRRGGR
jgi:16S rRNA (guanine527-N7)-methyltransferase